MNKLRFGNCKYHMVLRRNITAKTFYEEKRILGGRATGKEYGSAEVCQDHERMPVEIPQKMSMPSFAGFLKGKRGLTV